MIDPPQRSGMGAEHKNFTIKIHEEMRADWKKAAIDSGVTLREFVIASVETFVAGIRAIDASASCAAQVSVAAHGPEPEPEPDVGGVWLAPIDAAMVMGFRNYDELHANLTKRGMGRYGREFCVPACAFSHPYNAPTFSDSQMKTLTTLAAIGPSTSAELEEATGFSRDSVRTQLRFLFDVERAGKRYRISQGLRADKIAKLADTHGVKVEAAQ